MKKPYLLSLILICATIASLVIFTRAICDDDDCAFDLLCINASHFLCDDLFMNVSSQTGSLCKQGVEACPDQPTILYLELQEKSPPIHAVFS
jgi:hypothetical protein